MRALFYRQGDASFLNSSNTRFSGGVTSTSSTILEDHIAVNNLTGNKGNMIHREAMPKLLNIDRQASAYVNLIKLRDFCTSDAEYADVIEANFDCVILSMANFIQPGEQETRLHGLLTPLNLDIYVVGVGLQIPKPLEELAKSTQELLSFFNNKARLFAVRGKRTEAWAHRNGLHNAVALGCPSMFVYPDNMMRLKAPCNKSPLKLISAGHIHQAFLSKKKEGRAYVLMEALEGADVDYVFQSELFRFKEMLSLPNIFNEATSKISAADVNEYIYKKAKIKPPFKNYYQFDSPAAWRQASAHYDLYVGDRIHGAVAALQAGTPALIIYDDIRVKELADYFFLPSASLNDLMTFGLNELIAEKLNGQWEVTFKDRYIKVLKKFVRHINKAGLSMANEKDIQRLVADKIVKD